jgi:hypothetical protein
MEDWVNEDEDESGVFDDFQDASDEMFSNSKTINKKELNNGNNRIEDI